MKFRPARGKQNVVLELDPEDRSLPPIALPELRLKKILVPVDFSECSRKAMTYATCFARQFNSEIVLLNVVEIIAPPQMVFMESEALNAKLNEKAARQLSEWRGEVARHASVKAVVRNGSSAYQEIIGAATDGNVDLIIIGTHGRSGLAHVFLGSTAERVTRHAPCPVLVVREQEHDFVPGAEARSRSATERGHTSHSE